MDFAAQIAVWLNAVANTTGRLLAPIARLPGWLSATLVAAVTGILLLVVFKHTSNQRAIKRVRDDINAHLLALKLFRDSAAVAVRAQVRIFIAAVRLMVLALVPMAIMAIPVTLVLGQLSLWYQQRPLQVDEEAVVTVRLNGDVSSPMPEVSLKPADAIETQLGPVRAPGKRAVFWSIKARKPGYHQLAFQVGELNTAKELAVGDGFMRVSAQRPRWSWSDALLHPWEKPFPPESIVRSIEIDYPRRDSWVSGSDTWVIYWFAASMVAALCFRRVLNVNV